MTPLSLTLVPVTHNSARWLPGLFASWHAAIAAAEWGEQVRTAVVVADSGSVDETMARATEDSPGARALACGNVGFGAAANRGVEAAAAEWVLVCNPDITFDRDGLRRLVRPLLDRRDPRHDACVRAACIAPRLLNPDGSVQPSVGDFPTVRGMVRDQFRPRMERKYRFPQPTNMGPVDWVMGACLLIRRDAFLEVKGFDERFFLYVEEVDLQRRFADKGWRTLFLPEAVVTHHLPNAAHAPRPQVQRWAALGQRRYFAKHGGFWQLLAFRGLALASRRLTMGEAMVSRGAILAQGTRGE